MSNPISKLNWSDVEKTRYIRKKVAEAGLELRERYSWLKHQNTIGMSIMILSLFGMIGCGWLYAQGLIAWWLCIPLVALFASFIHELEHDLIHSVYFRTKPKLVRFLLVVGWIARPSTVNPLVRKHLHLHHHKYSGTESDLEERGITNGDRWSLKRLFITGDNFLALYFRPFQTIDMIKNYIHKQDHKTEAEKNKLKLLLPLSIYFPIGVLYYLVWHSYLVYLAAAFVMSAMGNPIVLSGWAIPLLDTLNFLAVAWFLPSTLRTFCLHFISSNMHYYGDVDRGNVMQQTQVLNAWWLMPFQLFCFNFGATHAIHHFLVKEPFYIRQWTAKQAHKVMQEVGVRFNDFGTFRRANRFHQEAA